MEDGLVCRRSGSRKNRLQRKAARRSEGYSALEPGSVSPTSSRALSLATYRMTVTLELQDISKSFDGFRALDRARPSRLSGKIHALLGENGAGKSTLMNICCGLYTPDAGVIKLFGAPVSLSGPREAAACGVGMLHQHFKLVRPFTILENVLLHDAGIFQKEVLSRGVFYRTQLDPRGCVVAQGRASTQTVVAGRTLSVAEQQRVEVIKALAGESPYPHSR